VGVCVGVCGGVVCGVCVCKGVWGCVCVWVGTQVVVVCSPVCVVVHVVCSGAWYVN